MVPPQLTTCCTQAGELAAVGSMTSDGSPPAIFGCACRIPSSTHSSPNPIRSSRRPRRLPGYGALSPVLRCGAGRRAPPGPGRGPGQPEKDDDEQRDRALV